MNKLINVCKMIFISTNQGISKQFVLFIVILVFFNSKHRRNLNIYMDNKYFFKLEIMRMFYDGLALQKRK